MSIPVSPLCILIMSLYMIYYYILYKPNGILHFQFKFEKINHYLLQSWNVEK